MSASARETMLDYYEALRRGDPLEPYFLDHPDVVKVGIGERLVGYDEVAEGLREQTRTTDSWSVESEALRVVAGDGFATVSDLVHLSWTDADSGRRNDFETRWSASLRREDGEWLFTGMHVSVPREV